MGYIINLDNLPPTRADNPSLEDMKYQRWHRPPQSGDRRYESGWRQRGNEYEVVLRPFSDNPSGSKDVIVVGKFMAWPSIGPDVYTALLEPDAPNVYGFRTKDWAILHILKHHGYLARDTT